MYIYMYIYIYIYWPTGGAEIVKKVAENSAF